MNSRPTREKNKQTKQPHNTKSLTSQAPTHSMLWSLRLEELHIRRDTDALRKDMRTATSSRQEDEGHPYSYNTTERTVLKGRGQLQQRW